jgi:hypothetical protein
MPDGKNFNITYGDGSEAQGFYSIDMVTVSFILGKKNSSMIFSFRLVALRSKTKHLRNAQAFMAWLAMASMVFLV